MSESELIGLYKGLRLPVLALVLVFIVWYVYRPKKKEAMEAAKYSMLEDEYTTNNQRK